MKDDLQCPYCGKDNEVCHDDGFGYQEDVLHEYQCRHCDKYFVFETTISFMYDAKLADCLNTGNHEYEKTKTYPKRYAKMRCIHCGDTRPLNITEEAQNAE